MVATFSGKDIYFDWELGTGTSSYQRSYFDIYVTPTANGDSISSILVNGVELIVTAPIAVALPSMQTTFVADIVREINNNTTVPDYSAEVMSNTFLRITINANGKYLYPIAITSIGNISSTANMNAGEAYGSDGGYANDSFRDYEITISRTSDSQILRKEYTTNSTYVYTFDKNSYDNTTAYPTNPAIAQRDITASIVLRDHFDNRSAPVILSVTNTVPSAPLNVTSKALTSSSYVVTADKPTDLDWGNNIAIFHSTSPVFSLTTTGTSSTSILSFTVNPAAGSHLLYYNDPITNATHFISNNFAGGFATLNAFVVALAANINNTPTVPNFSAVVNLNSITISADPSTGATLNGVQPIFSPNISATATALSGGVNATLAYAGSTGTQAIVTKNIVANSNVHIKVLYYDDFGISAAIASAQFTSSSIDLSTYSLSGGAPLAPTLLNIVSRQSVTPDGSTNFNFDMSWTAAINTIGYKIEIKQAGTLVWSGSTADPNLSIPIHQQSSTILYTINIWSENADGLLSATALTSTQPPFVFMSPVITPSITYNNHDTVVTFTSTPNQASGSNLLYVKYYISYSNVASTASLIGYGPIFGTFSHKVVISQINNNDTETRYFWYQLVTRAGTTSAPPVGAGVAVVVSKITEADIGSQTVASKNIANGALSHNAVMNNLTPISNSMNMGYKQISHVSLRTYSGNAMGMKTALDVIVPHPALLCSCTLSQNYSYTGLTTTPIAGVDIAGNIKLELLDLTSGTIVHTETHRCLTFIKGGGLVETIDNTSPTISFVYNRPPAEFVLVTGHQYVLKLFTELSVANVGGSVTTFDYITENCNLSIVEILK